MNAAIINAQLAGNAYVAETMRILGENGKPEEAELLKSVADDYDRLAAVIGELTDELRGVRGELSQLREERNHPLAEALRKLLNGLERRLDAVRTALGEVRAAIIDGCKNAVEAFRDGGVAALASIADFVQIQPKLIGLDAGVAEVIPYNDSRIAKIESLSRQYHEAGRAVGNIGRILRGGEALEAVKPNGKLSKLLTAPARLSNKYRYAIRSAVNSMFDAVERLSERRVEISVMKAIAEHSQNGGTREKSAPVRKKVQEVSL